MLNWKKNLLLVWISQFLSIAAFGSSLTFIPFYIKHLGVSDEALCSKYVSYFAALGSLSFCLVSPLWGLLADIYGRRIMLLRANFVSAFLIPLMAFVPNVHMLLLLRFLVGAFAGTVTASQTLIASNTPVENRGFALGAVSSALFSGVMAGMFLGGFVVDRFGYTVTFMGTGGLLLISGLFVLFGVREDFVRVTTLKEKIKEFKIKVPGFGYIWLMLVLMLLMGFARQFDNPFLPLLVEKVNGPVGAATWTGIIASVVAVAGIISGVLLGWLADRIGAPRVAVWSALLAGAFMLPQALAQSLLVLGAARFGMIFFAGGLDPVFQIWLAKCTPDDKRGMLFGLATSAKSMGWVLAALCGGSIAVHGGIREVFMFAGVIYIVLIPIIKFSAKKLQTEKAHEVEG